MADQSTLPPRRALARAGVSSLRASYAEVIEAQDLALLDEGRDGPPGQNRVRALLMTLWRRKWLLLAGLLIGFTIGAIVALMSPKLYVATANVQIDQQAPRVVEQTDSNDQSGGYLDVDRFLRTQMDVVRSRAILIRVADAGHLLSNDSFLQAMHVKLPKKSGNILQQEAARRKLVLATLEENFSADLPRDSRVATVAFRSPSPVVAADIANLFAQEFVMNNLDRRGSTSVYAREYLQRQIAAAQARLVSSENQLNAYARSANLIDTSLPSTNGSLSAARSPTTASLVSINDALAAATAARIQAQARFQSAQSGSLENIPDVLSNRTVQELTQQRATKTAALDQELKRHNEQFPTVLQARAELETLNRQITALETQIRNSIYEQYTQAVAQERNLQSKVSQLKSDTLSEQDRSVRYNIMRRDVDTNRSMYDALMQRYRTLSASAGSTSNNISVIDTAEAPDKPASPKLTIYALLGAALGLMLTAGGVLLADEFDTSIRSVEDAERALALPVLGIVPRDRNGRTFIRNALAGKRGSGSEAYTSIAVAITNMLRDSPPRSLVVTSSQAGEGKTSSSILLARTYARRGKKVLLVDADLRRSSMASLTGGKDRKGLTDVLAGTADMADVITGTDDPNLFLMPSGVGSAEQIDLLLSESIADMLERATAFDLVILDAPPVLGLADAVILSSVADATIFIVEAMRIKRGQARAALKRLQAGRGNLVGMVLNKVPATDVHLAYGEYYLTYGKE